MGFKLSIEQGKGRGQSFDFDAESISIGRTEENDVVLYEQGVSRKHARITAQDGKYFVEDLDSANGTLLNGKKIKKEPLGEGDTIGIGAVVFRYGESKGGSKGAANARVITGDKGSSTSGATVKGPAPSPSNASTPAPAAASAASAPAAPGAPVFNPRTVVITVSAMLILAIGWAAWQGRSPRSGGSKEACPTDAIRLEGQSISTMVFSTSSPESVCMPGKQLSFGFVGQPRTRYLFSYSAFYTDMNGIEVYINGEKWKEGSPLANTRRSKPAEIMIDEKQVKIGKDENVVTFKTNRSQWGIERIELTPIALDNADPQQAMEYFRRGEQLFEQKNVSADNLYNAYLSLKRARQLMEAMEPKPADFVVVKELIKTVNGELDRLCTDKLFYVRKQQTFGKYELANGGYKYLLVAFPGDEHPCRQRVIDELGGPQRVKALYGNPQP